MSDYIVQYAPNTFEVNISDGGARAYTDATVAAAQYYLGNGFAVFGDSIASVSGGAGYGNSWSIMSPILSNQRLNYRGNLGIAGETSAQVLARVGDALAIGARIVVILVGHNDLTNGVTLATYQANITAIVTSLRAGGSLPVLCTLCPRGNTTYLAKELLYNNWLRYYAQAQRIPLVDFFALLTDPATGMYLSGYDCGDGLHPSAAGHMAMAAYFNTKMAGYLQPYEPMRALTNTDANNLLSNPLLIDGTPTPTGWGAQGTTMTGYTEQLVTDSDFLGKAWEIDLNTPSNAGGYRQIYQTVAASWSAGDMLLFCWRQKIVASTNVTPGFLIGAQVQGLFFNAPTTFVNFMPGDSIVHAAGLCWFRHTIEAGTTLIQLAVSVATIPVNGRLQARFGEFGIYNLTTLGLL
jgi:lysophospholipase L1-like esterase